MTNDLNEMMKYITQLETYVYKLEANETDVDEDTGETDVDEVEEVVDEPSNETEIQSNENIVTEVELRLVKWFNNTKDYSRNWEKILKKLMISNQELINNEII